MSDVRKPDSPPLPPTPTLVQSPNFRVIYANGFSYKPSVSDFGLTPLVQVPVVQQAPDGNTINTNSHVQEVMIMLSLPGLKALSENLALIVKEIEQEIGHIRVTRGSIINDDQIRSLSEVLKATPLQD
jgi:hypothetical protein